MKRSTCPTKACVSTTPSYPMKQLMIVKKYLEQLPEDYQQIIELVYGMGYTNVEVARVLNITPNAVTLKLFRAKKRLLEIAGGELSERLH